MDSLQASIDAESKAKSDVLKIKKTLENNINELEIALDHSNKSNIEAQKAIKNTIEINFDSWRHFWVRSDPFVLLCLFHHYNMKIIS